MAISPAPSDTTSIRDWSALPSELLNLILQKLVLLPDYIRFSVVCKEWFSVALEQKRKHKRVNPMLFVPNEDKDYRNLFNIWDNSVYGYQFPIPYRRRCSGSSYGWWAVAEKDLSITLVNPFSSKTIHLPPITDLPEIYDPHSPFHPEYLIVKVILSCDPSLHPDNYVAVGIYNNNSKVAFIRSGEQAWNYIDSSFTTAKDCQFYRGRLYVTNSSNQLIAIDCNSHTRVAMEYVVAEKAMKGSECSRLSYLVESLDGDLLLVRRIFLYHEYDVTLGFKIYKLVIKHTDKTKKGIWVEIDSLGMSALFLGNNQSICLSATSLPTCQPNSIYYTADNRQWEEDPDFVPNDIGIFDMESKQIRKYYEIPDPKRPAAVWILPTLS